MTRAPSRAPIPNPTATAPSGAKRRQAMGAAEERRLGGPSKALEAALRKAAGPSVLPGWPLTKLTTAPPVRKAHSHATAADPDCTQAGLRVGRAQLGHGHWVHHTNRSGQDHRTPLFTKQPGTTPGQLIRSLSVFTGPPVAHVQYQPSQSGSSGGCRFRHHPPRPRRWSHHRHGCVCPFTTRPRPLHTGHRWLEGSTRAAPTSPFAPQMGGGG